MIQYISAFLDIIISRNYHDLQNLINRLFEDYHGCGLKVAQKNCSYILACVGYECFRMSSMNEKKAAKALLDCDSLFRTVSLHTLQLLFTAVMANIYEAADGDSAAPEYDVLDTVNDLLYNNCAGVSLQEAADLLGVSIASFSINFKKRTGNNFKDYVRTQKMELAKRMLEDTQDSVKTISENLGYFDTNYFTRIFKTTYGVTPSTYRRTVNH